MRVTYRSRNNKDYWEERWSSIPADAAMENTAKYPLKYAEMIIRGDKQGRILEAGCGAGRVLRFYKDRGYKITGFDFIPVAVDKLKQVDPGLDVRVGDIQNLDFKDGEFRYLLAFGLYHNLYQGLEKAVDETFRVLEPGGYVCASFRADNVQTRLTDLLADYRSWRAGKLDKGKEFHKLNLTKGEFVRLFEKAGFEVENVFPVENMPIFYKFAFFRAHDHKNFNESLGRKEGYKLSPAGQALQQLALKLAPLQFCNIFVMIAKKPKRT